MNSHSAIWIVPRWLQLGVVATLFLVLGCTLPLSTAAPQPATTVGKGGWGAAITTEIPTIDVVATSESNTFDDRELVTTFAAASLELSYGLTDRLDIEGSLDGALLILIPIPVGASLGARFALIDKPSLAVSVSGRVGRMSLGKGTDDDGNVETQYTATHARVSTAVQLRPRRRFRPGVAISALPARITERGEQNRTDFGLALSGTVNLTFVLGPVHIGPFFNTAYYTSSALEENHLVYSGGLLFAARPR